MARPKFAPKSTPYCGPIAKPHHLPHPWSRPTYDAKRHPDPIRRFSTMHWTDRPTDGPTDRSSTGKFGDYRTLSSEIDCEELDLATIFSSFHCKLRVIIDVIVVENWIYSQENQQKLPAEMALFDSSMHQIVRRLGLHPRPDHILGACSAPPDPLAVFRAYFFLEAGKGRGDEEKGVHGKGRHERRGRWRGGNRPLVCEQKKKSRRLCCLRPKTACEFSWKF